MLRASNEPEKIVSIVDGRRGFACSQAQKRFWFEEQLHPGNASLNVAVRWRLDGPITGSQLDDAWRKLLRRHASLRTSFGPGDDDVAQWVAANVDFSVREVDLSILPKESIAGEIDRLSDIEACQPFDLSVAPLLRVTRLRTDELSSVLLVTTHHTVCDGWSIGILARELLEALTTERNVERSSVPTYVDYAKSEREWLHANSLEREIATLRPVFADYHQFEILPDRPRPAVQTSNGRIESTLLEKSLTGELNALATSQGCTLFIAAFSALLVLLHRYSGETDIAIGTQVAGRDDDAFENIVGCFVNSIILRSDLGGDPSFRALLERTRDRVMDSLEFRHVPLERLIEIVKPHRDLSRNALVSTNFIFQRSFIKNETVGDLSLVDLPSRSAGSLYDLNFFMVERAEGWRFSCEYNADLFDRSTIVGMLGHFRTLLESVVADANVAISALPIFTATERRDAIARGNDTRKPYPQHLTVVDLFAEHVARTPQAVAVIFRDVPTTYRDLDIASTLVACELLRRGVKPASRIGVILDRSSDLLVGLLGVLKAGCAYVPIDPTYPRARLDYIVEKSELHAVVTSTKYGERLADLPLPRVFTDALSEHDRSTVPATVSPKPDDVAYTIYTSGSTGKPKGVQIQHRALVNLLFAMRMEPGLGASDVLLAVTTISFDIAALELFLPLVTGATVAIAASDEAMNGVALRSLIERTAATVMQATPITWRLLLEAGWTGRPQLKMLCGGEALSRELATRLLACGGELWNMYGPTETTIWSSAARVRAQKGPVPVGPPIANTRFYVLDSNGELVPDSAPGELHIGGDGVALGYFALPIETKSRFVNDPFSDVPGARLYRTGDIVRRIANSHEYEFLGRNDNQVKLRGFRIELGEVEAMLLQQDDVIDAVALVSSRETDDNRLIAYAVRSPGSSVSSSEFEKTLRLRIAEMAPAYMVPAQILVIDSLPRTPNGKIDRKALPELVSPRVGVDSTSGVDTHAFVSRGDGSLKAIAADLLGHDRFSDDEDLFAVGLHSLLAMRFLMRIKHTYGVEIPLRTLFEHPTLGELIPRIELLREMQTNVESEGRAITALNPKGTQAAFFFFHGDYEWDGIYSRRIASELGSDQPVYSIAPHGTAGLAPLERVEEMARDTYDRVRSIQPSGPYRIGGFCIGGLVAYELARLLRSNGETVERLILINASTLPSRNVPGFDWLIRQVALSAKLSGRTRMRLCYALGVLHAAFATGPMSFFRSVRDRLPTFLKPRERGWRTQEMAAAPAFYLEPNRRLQADQAFAQVLAAAFCYHPTPYTGEIILLWGKHQNSPVGIAERTWRSVATQVRTVMIDGGHADLLNVHVVELARKIKDALAIT